MIIYFLVHYNVYSSFVNMYILSNHDKKVFMSVRLSVYNCFLTIADKMVNLTCLVTSTLTIFPDHGGTNGFKLS